MTRDDVECVLGTGREVLIVGREKGRDVYSVQPHGDNYWVNTTDLDRAVRLGNGCPTAADRRWLKAQQKTA